MELTTAPQAKKVPSIQSCLPKGVCAEVVASTRHSLGTIKGGDGGGDGTAGRDGDDFA